ncbi:cadmium resistance transporter, partial [Staphylococcus pettenkoferi]|uniref:cadmium resistance transporter n=1 Tax=Staphylococcus pettenkoferi TaxID=170573 RepID=UPI001643221D
PQYLPSVPLILLTLFFPFLLNYLPQKSILPLLPLIPIYLRIKLPIYHHSQRQNTPKKQFNQKPFSKLLPTLPILTIPTSPPHNIP